MWVSRFFQQDLFIQKRANQLPLVTDLPMAPPIEQGEEKPLFRPPLDLAATTDDASQVLLLHLSAHRAHRLVGVDSWVIMPRRQQTRLDNGSGEHRNHNLAGGAILRS